MAEEEYRPHSEEEETDIEEGREQRRPDKGG